MKIKPDQSLREHLLYVLQGGGAHITFDDVIPRFPTVLRGKQPKGVPYSAWMLLEHMRLAQWDILDFSINPKYKPMEWPRDYWPAAAAPRSAAAWNVSVKTFRKDLKAMQDLVANPKTDLHARIPWGEGQTILREAILLADHNAYHLGQLVMLGKMPGAG
jgi:hypothetical protein